MLDKIKQLLSPLAVRITLLILFVGPVIYLLLTLLLTFIVQMFFNESLVGLIIVLAGFLLNVIFTSAILGLISSRFVIRPLRRLQTIIVKLQDGEEDIDLRPSGIRDIDQIINTFNSFISQLKQESELRKNLISDTSHELKTPIATMMIQLQGVKDGVLKLDAKRVELLYDQAERLHDLVQHLQDYSRIRSRSVKPELQEVNMHKLVLTCQKMLENQASQKGMLIQNLVSPDFTVRADPKLMEQVFCNVIENAIKYSGGYLITIQAERSRLTIEDNGIGISESKLPYIFERFYRVEDSRSRQTGGLGLGLAIVKEIVEAHGWRITARNQERDQHGLVFEICI